MSLYPEQERALKYVRRRGSEAPVSDIRGRVTATYLDIEVLVRSISAEVARRRPEPGRWSVLEVVDHLVESDRRAVPQLGALLAGRDVDEAIPAGLQSATPLDVDWDAVDWDALRADFAAVHAAIVALLDAASDSVPQTATAPVEMVVKHVADDGTARPVHWFERFDWKAYAILLHAHNREHVDQIRRILAVVGEP